MFIIVEEIYIKDKVTYGPELKVHSIQKQLPIKDNRWSEIQKETRKNPILKLVVEY